MMKLHMLPVGPIQANCYILCDEEEKKCAVIDPGGEGAKVARAVKLTDCEPVAVYLTHGDTQEDANLLADKIAKLRIFSDENDKMNLSVTDVDGGIIVVSQFTLYADTSSRRPGFSGAAKPDLAIPLYERFMAHCRERGFAVEHGEFGADMQVESVNDGPVTLILDTAELMDTPRHK